MSDVQVNRRMGGLAFLVALVFFSAWCGTIGMSAAPSPVASKPALAGGTVILTPRIVTKPETLVSAVAIEGPNVANVGQTIRLRMSGLPEVDFTKPLGDQLGWAKTLSFAVFDPDEKGNHEFNAEMVLTFPLGLAMRLEFTARKPGTYGVIVDWNNAPAQLLIHRIVVGGQPDPPDPPDPPGPNPGGKKQFAFWVEGNDLDNLSLPRRGMVTGQAFREGLITKGHRFVGRLDPDQADKAPEDIKPWYVAGKGKTGPHLLLAPLDGGTIVAHALPETEAETLKLIEGGK